MKRTSKFIAIVLSILLSIVLVAPAETYDKTLFMEEKNNLSNEMNIRTLLGVEDTSVTSGIRNFLIVLDISEALEKFYHGEYNDGAAILAKVGVTTFSAIAGIIAAAIDVGTVYRDKVVETVFGPQVQEFCDEYHKTRMDDLKRLLDEKKLGFNGTDFANWAADADGAVADKSGSSDVNFFVDDKVIGPSANRGLYNIAQMKIQDQRHSERPWYIKLIGRVAPSENPVSHEEARDYWLREWNRKVVIDGMEYIVGMKKQYIETFTGSSTINCVVEVKRPVEGLQYELECYELEWNEIQTPVEGLAGLQVMFLKSVDLDDFMEVTRNPRHKGVVRFELLLPDGKVAQVKDVKFADMMYAASSKKFEDETGIWREYRAKVDFDWEPPRVDTINIELPSEAKLERLNIQMGLARVNLTTAGTDSGMPGQKSGVFSLLQWVNSTSFDVLTLLEQMQFAPESYLIPPQGSAYPSVSVTVSYKIQEERDDEVVERDIGQTVTVDLLEEDNSFTIPAYTRPDYTGKTSEELMAIYKRVASSFISSPGTYPGDLLRLRTELPWGYSENYTAWTEQVAEPANAKLEASLVGSFKALDDEAEELQKKYAASWYEKQHALRDLQTTISILCYSSFALPINRDKIISEIDEFMAEAEAVRQEVKADRVLTEKLLASAQRDIVPEIAAQRNLFQVSSHYDLPQKVSRTIANLEDMLVDQDFALGEIAQMEIESQTLLASFDTRLADLEQRAAAGAFYGKRVEQLQAEAEALGRQAEVLGAATIRQQESIYRLRDLLRAFNGWASARTRSLVNLNLDALYQYVAGAEPPASGGELPAIDAMVEELMAAFYRLTSEEIEYLDRFAEFEEQRIKVLKDAFDRSGKDNFSPMSALYASHLSLSDLEPALNANGSLQNTALRPALDRARQIEESWRASLLVRAPGYWYCLATMLGPDIEAFIDLCDTPETSEGNAAVQEWHATGERIEANMEQLGTVGIAGLGAMVADVCADLDKLGQIIYSPILAKAAWREHYTILREWTGAARTIGDRYFDAMADAVVRLLDVADANFHARLSKALTLSGSARDKELAELSEMTSDNGMGAVGIGSLSDTQSGWAIGVLLGSRNPGPFEAVQLKWSDVVSGWMSALENSKEEQP